MAQSQIAHAQDIERARELFQEASTLREGGLYDQAIVRLKQAIAIKDTPGLEYHAGFCESKLGHYRRAIKYYERAAALLRAGAAAPDVISLLPPAHEYVVAHAAKLRIEISGTSQSAMLRLDDEAEQPLPNGDLLVDPGKHHLVFSARSFKLEERNITVADAEHLRIDVRMTPIENQSPAQAAPASNAFPWKTASIGVGLSAAAAGLGLLIVSAVQRHNAQGRIDLYRGIVSTCSQTCSGPQLQLNQASSDKDSATRWETVGFVAAGVGAVATVALWTLWPSSRAVTVGVDSRGGISSASVTAAYEF
jgi:hypothetical protein